MKKLIITLSIIVLTGCSIQSNNEENIQVNEALQSEINILQDKIDQGLLTEAQAKAELESLIRLNDGSIESILKKMAIQSPEAAAEFEKKIRENNPEQFTK